MRSYRLALLIATLAASAAFAARPILKVNDTQLTDIDLKLAQQLVTDQMKAQVPGTPPSADIVMRHAVEQLIGRAVLLQAALEAKTTVDPAQVTATVEQQRSARGPEAFGKYMAEYGLTEKDLATRIESQLVVRKFVDTVLAPKITVTDADAKTFYDSNPKFFEHPEEVKIRFILIKSESTADEKTDAATKVRAEDTRKRVLLGEEMGKVAKEVSDDPSKTRGGEIGWVRKGMLMPDLEPAVWALKPGELSGVLKSKYGYHIFEVEDRRGPGKLSFDDVKPRLISTLKSEKTGQAIEALVKELRAKAKIEALDPAVKAALAPPPPMEAKPPVPGKPATAPAGQQHPNAPKQP